MIPKNSQILFNPFSFFNFQYSTFNSKPSAVNSQQTTDFVHVFFAMSIELTADS